MFTLASVSLASLCSFLSKDLDMFCVKNWQLLLLQLSLHGAVQEKCKVLYILALTSPQKLPEWGWTQWQTSTPGFAISPH